MSSNAVDPHTATLIVSIGLPGMFLVFALAGTAIYLRKRAGWWENARQRKMEADAKGENEPGQYEKWLEHVLAPGASQAPSQNPSFVRRNMTDGGVDAKGRDGGKARERAKDKVGMATVQETAVGEAIGMAR